MDMIERVARAIAKGFGEDFDYVVKNKRDWMDRMRTEKGFNRDINMPMQTDYIAMAEAALEAVETIEKLRARVAEEADTQQETK